jgi:hypothetical protein
MRIMRLTPGLNPDPTCAACNRLDTELASLESQLSSAFAELDVKDMRLARLEAHKCASPLEGTE